MHRPKFLKILGVWRGYRIGNRSTSICVSRVTLTDSLLTIWMCVTSSTKRGQILEVVSFIYANYSECSIMWHSVSTAIHVTAHSRHPTCWRYFGICHPQNSHFWTLNPYLLFTGMGKQTNKQKNGEFYRNNFTAWSDHKCLAGHVMVGRRAPGT